MKGNLFVHNVPIRLYLRRYGNNRFTYSVIVNYGGLGETWSAGTNGYDVFGGPEFPLRRYGVPLTILGGINYIVFGNLNLTETEESLNYPLVVGGITFHVGLKFAF